MPDRLPADHPVPAITWRERLPWIAVLVTLATAVVVLLGPLWSTAAGENPLERPSFANDPEALTRVLRLALPTVMVLASVAVALGDRRRWWLGALGLLVFGYAVLVAPAPLPVWFVPSLVLTGLAYVLTLRGRSLS